MVNAINILLNENVEVISTFTLRKQQLTNTITSIAIIYRAPNPPCLLVVYDA